MSKIHFNKKGFTLTEVMIGIMILTVAIVSATSLLVGLLSTNQNNLTTLQAYYLAQEGLEATRNIRDTNWLHNLDWLGADSGLVWGAYFVADPAVGNEYVIDLKPPFQACAAGEGLVGIANCSPWKINDALKPEAGKIFKYGSAANETVYLSSVAGNADNAETLFRRVITIKPYDCVKAEICSEGEQKDFVLVESKVIWSLGAKERELKLYEILTNWKGGAL